MSTVTALKQNQWPALTEMGVTRFHEISHYALIEESSRDDILKIYYKRAKGSLLPYSRKYRFGRSIKTVVEDSGTARMEDTYEISPYLQQAIVELDALIVQNREQGESEPAPSSSDERKRAILEALASAEALAESRLTAEEAASLRESLDVARTHVDAI